jgi:SAM-dependent methyltransferase
VRYRFHHEIPGGAFQREVYRPGVSTRSIDRAKEFAADSPQQLAFAVGTMDALDFGPNSFDAVVAIESLYFSKDLTRALHQFRMVLRPRGQIALFFTHIAEAGARLGPDDTMLATALHANQIPYKTHDLTESDRRFWERCKVVGEELRGKFEAEGNDDLTRLGETEALLDFIKQGRPALLVPCPTNLIVRRAEAVNRSLTLLMPLFFP